MNRAIKVVASKEKWSFREKCLGYRTGSMQSIFSHKYRQCFHVKFATIILSLMATISMTNAAFALDTLPLPTPMNMPIKPNAQAKKDAPVAIEKEAPVIKKSTNPLQQSINEYKQAISYIQQGRITEANGRLEESLRLNVSNNDARLVLAGLMVDQLQLEQANALLKEGLTVNPVSIPFRLAIASIEVALHHENAALKTLEDGVGYANNNAEYQLLLATSLRRAARHEDAIKAYMDSLNAKQALSESATVMSLVGLGISLRSTGKLEQAKEAFTRAQASTSTEPELRQFIADSIRQLGH